MEEDKVQTAILAAGCFWCYEAIYQRVKGIKSVMPGYTGGASDNPTYEEVCTGTTGHAEAVEIEFDSTEISFQEVLDIFWHVHDPTTPNRQGNDVGTQYRSAIFYVNNEQKKIATESKQEAQAEFTDPIVTEISAFDKFYPAEDYHKNYFANNPGSGYCQMVVSPKIEKFEKLFVDKLK